MGIKIFVSGIGLIFLIVSFILRRKARKKENIDKKQKIKLLLFSLLSTGIAIVFLFISNHL